MSIPKRIHYCWFGNKAKGKLIEDCIQTWKQHLPDYEIKEWNERNYQSDSFFYRHAIKNKKFAFASDFARFDILDKEGGIYLDTDMLLLQSLHPFLVNECFFGYEDEKHISCGIIGAVSNHPFIKNVLDVLQRVNDVAFFEKYTIVRTVNEVHQRMMENDKLPPLKVYPMDVFYPFPYAADGDPFSYATKNTVAIHLWNASWFTDFSRANLLLKQGKKSEARITYLRSLLQSPKNIRFFFKFI